MADLIEWVEKAAADNLRERIEIAAMIQREANTTLTLLLSGAGASLIFAAHTGSNELAIARAALVVSAYLFLIGGLLVRECLGLIAYPASSNEPKNLNNKDYAFEQMREWELENIQARIDQAVVINEHRSKWLNRCRYIAMLSPL
jgi:hypothetical protein